MLCPTISVAQSCTFSVSNLSFGPIDTLGGAQVNSTASINVSCNGILLSRMLICPNLAGGSGGASSATARQMPSGVNKLNYQLYSDAARTVTWGSFNWAYAARSPAYALTLGALGTARAQ